jgi:hypothetical protein
MLKHLVLIISAIFHLIMSEMCVLSVWLGNANVKKASSRCGAKKLAVARINLQTELK